MRPTKTELRYEAIAAAAMAVLIFFAYKIVGFLGIGILGMVTMFVAFQANLSKSNTSATYGILARPPHIMDHAERAARRAEAESLSHPILMGILLGACLAVIGFGAMLLL
ncbi:MAG: hypothetical protein Q8M24_04160 [Pseudolabrys sp.]|nr:hypothetical protein [Pseudolabrys sp.]MDP2294641.1 hypothetical protein [Pseudolabrys sp.]